MTEPNDGTLLRKKADMISASEAAKQLGVSTRRVTELARAGALDARKVSGVWLVSEDSVAERLSHVSKKGGRPAAGKAWGEVLLTLMNRTHEVAEVVYDTREKRFSRVKELLDLRRAPIGIASDKALPLLALNQWWRWRGIPDTRAHLDHLLREAGCSVPEELLERNLGLSLSDHYWVRPHGSGLTWESVNFFNNDFERIAALLQPAAIAEGKGGAHPDNTSDGNLTKTWENRGGHRVLVKGGGTLCQEPLNEVVATALHERLLDEGEFVRYEAEEADGGFASVCENFLADDEEYVPAVYVERLLDEDRFSDGYRHYVACAESLGAQDVEGSLARMIVCDDIIANSDRHHRNFGLVRNVETLQCRCAPIFDSGASLWHDVPLARLKTGEHSFESKQFFASPARQLLLVEDMSWVDADTLEGFADEAVGILSRNVELVGRLPFIRSALEWRIERITNIVRYA